MRTVLFSTYELGRQPFGLASAAAWLRRAGADVSVHDLSVHAFDDRMLDGAEVVGVYVPMHTATRLAEPVIQRTRSTAPEAHIVAFGLYASMNEGRLRDLGVDSVIAGEFEGRLVEIHDALAAGRRAEISSEPVQRQRFMVPDRDGLPALSRYARFQPPGESRRVVGYTEATRGCKHLCRHCPIVPVYGGRFVVVDPAVVLADVRAQVAAGARHVTFGDPDFFNGPAHALRVVRAIHEEFPDVTYDVTIKVEHLARHLELLPELENTGCVLVTTAVESFDPEILERFDKRHEPGDFERVLVEMHRVGLAVNPTFVAFTPWTTLDGYLGFLDRIARLGLIGNISPIQYGIRLLVPAGSLLLELPDMAALAGHFDETALAHPWSHPEPAVDALQERVMGIVATAGEESRGEVFRRVWALARDAAGSDAPWPVEPPLDEAVPIATVPYLTEPWYC
jgi:radical SAM superfamily enzyme YgiQ (UPF0313 family)